jgi:hypothetical protein
VILDWGFILFYTLIFTSISAIIVIVVTGVRSTNKERRYYLNGLYSMVQSLGVSVIKREVREKGYVIPQNTTIQVVNIDNLSGINRIIEGILEFHRFPLDGVILTTYSTTSRKWNRLEFVVIGKLSQDIQDEYDHDFIAVNRSSNKKTDGKIKEKDKVLRNRFFSFSTKLYFKETKYRNLVWDGERHLVEVLDGDTRLKKWLTTLGTNHTDFEEIIVAYVPKAGYAIIRTPRYLPSEEDFEMFGKIAQYIRHVWFGAK